MSFQTRNLYHLRVSEHSVLPLYLYLDENHVEWMTRSILKEIIADLKPLIGPKLVKESHIGASGLSASAMKKAGQSVVEVQRGDNYQFAYFLKPAESYDILIKTRDFVPVAASKRSPTPSLERTPTPEPPKKKRGKAAKGKPKRAPKTKSRPRVSSAAKKRKRVEADEEEDAEMSDAWSNLDDSIEGSQVGEPEGGAAAPPSLAPTRRSARQKNNPQIEAVDVDEDMEQDTTAAPSTTQDPQPMVIVKPEPDDTSALANLLPISMEDESTPAPHSPSLKPPSEHIMVEDEEEKPKQELRLKYAGHVIPSRCICVIAEPWPALPTPAQLASQATRRQRRPTSPPPTTNTRPLFRADSDDEEEGGNKAPPKSPSPEFDSDDEEGRLRMFSQMINKVGERRSGVAARGGMDEFEDDALYGDADEEGRNI
ncbi:hypothetical protein BDV93DRAFT_521734 [Ceratobasidium sp. AG-I]|nr:hypothetical protein BDV93DRAFT_521734 [Ceratobasidium sp. AG-I]